MAALTPEKSTELTIGRMQRAIPLLRTIARAVGPTYALTETQKTKVVNDLRQAVELIASAAIAKPESNAKVTTYNYEL